MYNLYSRLIAAFKWNPYVQVLITTGEDKFYSNGLDLKWISDPVKFAELGQFIKRTFKRVLTFPVVTIAAINGHAFAGGAMFAMTHDVRVMKSERGWICLNEIHMKMRIPHWLLEIVRCKIPSGPVEQFLFVFGKRFTAKEALEERLVNRICPGERLTEEAVQLGRDILGRETYDRKCLQQMKADVYKKALDLMDQPAEDKARL